MSVFYTPHTSDSNGISIEYIPLERDTPRLFTEKGSAWGDIPTIIKHIINRFNIKTEKALEFGTEWGYSTTALEFYNYPHSHGLGILVRK